MNHIMRRRLPPELPLVEFYPCRRLVKGIVSGAAGALDDKPAPLGRTRPPELARLAFA
jgi:hypothetical protein